MKNNKKYYNQFDNNNQNIKSQHGSYYEVNVCYSSLTSPGYFDYMHLVFWFYFLTTFIISVWLLYSFICTMYYNEKKKPILETRGFSRAQTGDSVTAIIPMTWSITMLMHASTNSYNFDENTDSTAFTLTIIAYQWGWNYFLPKDVLFKNENELNYSDLISLNTNVKLDKNLEFLNFKNFKNEKKFLNFITLHKSQIIINNNVQNLNDLNSFNIVFNDELFFFKNINIDNSIVNSNIKFNINKKFFIKKPMCFFDQNNDWSSVNLIEEYSSSRSNILNFKTNLSLNGGLSHRLSISSGLVLPSNTPIHLICGSKDVIHSWAIPGLFIKIDCIPGYNCHRRVFLKWRGLYWGQCMEVCGRYHHWMPILVKVTHYDLFVIWAKSFFKN